MLFKGRRKPRLPGGIGAGRYKIALPENFELLELYRLAAQRDLQLRRMSYRRDTLQDIFLEAMKA